MRSVMIANCLSTFSLIVLCIAVGAGELCVKSYIDGEWITYGHCKSEVTLESIVNELKNMDAIGNSEPATTTLSERTFTTTDDATISAATSAESTTLPDLTTTQAPATTTVNPWPGWQKSGNRYFKCFNDRRVTYFSARDGCNGIGGGRLAAEVLRDPVAVRYISTFCYTNGVNLPWIGLDDLASEGTYVWSDGGSMSSATTRWRVGEPSNSGGIEDCAHILEVSADKKLLLNDNSCNANFQYICEI